MKVTVLSGCQEINFLSQSKYPLCFTDPYLFSCQPHSLVTKSSLEPKMENSNEQEQRVAYTSILYTCSLWKWIPFLSYYFLSTFWHVYTSCMSWRLECSLCGLFFHLHVKTRESMYVCERQSERLRESMHFSEWEICALVWRTGEDGWKANLFLCRLTLSFQTPLFSKTPTISSVCLSSPLLLPPSSLSSFSLIASLYSLSDCQSGCLPGPLCICVGERWICRQGVHPLFLRA